MSDELKQCDSVSSGEYGPRLRCQLIADGHTRHFAAGGFTVQVWESVSFPIHYIADLEKIPVPKAEPGRRELPTFADLEQAELFDPVVHHALSLYRSGDYTREQALIAMALALSKERSRLYREITELMARLPARTPV